MEQAKSVGLSIPTSYIISDKQSLKEMIKSFFLITKSCNEVLNLEYDDTVKFTLTHDISENDSEKMASHFFPSFVQSNISKSYEVRSFLFSDKIWSMAIFSQNNDKTKTDYRNYDDEIPNRLIPHELPALISDKLFKLFKALKLNSGSVDFIVDNNNKYYFLEVNPDGQFDWVSENCNYYIELEIAKILLNR